MESEESDTNGNIEKNSEQKKIEVKEEKPQITYENLSLNLERNVISESTNNDEKERIHSADVRDNDSISKIYNYGEEFRL